MTSASALVDDVLTSLAARYTSPEERAYLGEHRERYRLLLSLVQHADPARVLDVGPAYQTEAIRTLLPGAVVDTLGFADERFQPREGERHVEFDLNDAQDHERWPLLPEYDLVVMAEVLEHLYTSPVLVLRFLATALAPGGHLLLQTPNAAALPNRLRLLAGHNPFEQIREASGNPGHFREYTVRELLEIGRQAGLVPIEWRTANYFDRGSRQSWIFNAVGSVLPPRLRAGITATFRRSLHAR